MLVSVIIPCYNVEKYIAECLDSVLVQSYPDLEVICVDNGSGDDTGKIIEAYRKNHPEKIIFLKEEKKGAPHARNKGLQSSRGQWIQFLDADDLLLPAKISHQINLVSASNGDFAFVAGACFKRTVTGAEHVVSIPAVNKFLAPFRSQCGNTCSNLWKRTALNKAGNWNENLKSSQETDLMLRLLLNGGEMLVDNTPLTIIRERESGQISQLDPSEKWERFINVRVGHLTVIRQKFPAVYLEFRSDFLTSLLSPILILARYNVRKASIFFKLVRPEIEFIQPSRNISGKVISLIRFIGFRGTVLMLKLSGRS